MGSGSSDNGNKPVTEKGTASSPAAAASIAKAVPNRQHADNGTALSPVSPAPSLSRPFPGNGANRTLSQPAPVSRATPKASAWTTIRLFVPLGIEHILTGYDHIAFLLAIIVIGLSIKEVLKVITAFTIAHSITLLLAAMEIIRLNSRFVESVIAFSICYVALENLYKKKVNYRWLIAFGFGLIHGFGFASALQELIVRKANLLLTVVSFNAGVEMGQLIVFFVLLPILYLLKKQINFRIVTVATSVGIFAIGFTWLIERVFQLKLLWF
jgi:hydrogenase/urease accessory protein HupE